MFPTARIAEMSQDLVDAAKKARLKAYAPYSKFLVGAAVRDEEGRVFSGCNIENAAYPQGWCAESSAITAMIMAGGKQVTEAVVIGAGEKLVTPCGGCRQKLREFAAGTIEIHVCGEDGSIRKTFTLDELLPHSFGPDHLR